MKLFSFAFILGLVAAKQQWVIVPSPTNSLSRTDSNDLGVSRAQRLASDERFDVRGHYGALVLLVVNDRDFSSLERELLDVKPVKVLEYNEDVLTVVEKPIGWEDVNSQRGWKETITTDMKNRRPKFLTIEEDRAIFVGKVGEYQFPLEYDEIPVATHAIQPPRDFFDTSLIRNIEMKTGHPVLKEKDDRIEGMVLEVSADSIRDAVQELSTVHWSRLSFSPYAVDAQRWLENRFLDLGLAVSRYTFNESLISTVIGDIPGTVDPNMVVLVGAHLDSRQEMNQDPFARAPGADDNGSGVAMLLELGEILRQYQYQYTIRLVGWTGEEQGLLGSRAYAAQARQDGMQIVGVFNGDMLGYKPPEGPYEVGFKDRNISPLLTEFCIDIAMQYVGWPSAYSSSCCSDYLPFDEEGYAAVGFFENNITASANPNYHRSTDTYEYLDYTLAEGITRAMLASTATLAQII